MPTAGTMPPESFLRDLRWALRHLYNPEKLSESPLLKVLGVDPRESPSALRRILSQAIHALAPDAGVSTDSHAWRVYYTLRHRYLDQFSQQQVAMSLGLSIRQMRRQDRLALRVLADYLLCHHAVEQTNPPPSAGPSEKPSATAEEIGPERELQWLRKAFPSEAVSVAEVLPPLVNLIVPLAESLRVRVEYSVANQLPRLAVQVAAMRQALLSVLTAAVRTVPGGQVALTVQAAGRQVCITVIAERSAHDGAAIGVTGGLDLARQLAEVSGGSLDVRSGEDEIHPLIATLVLPAVEQVAVLFVDDNADTLQLYQRYLAGTRYPFLGARDPQQAMSLAEELSPSIIVLDLMLPGVDGWELLGRFREHPRTQGVPIIVCSILEQRELAFLLGAAEFLVKPVSRDVLLAALDRQLARRSPGCQ
ncbi:MAG: response regulator [Anaerolineae bacterium]|nr:response regulator [Anaerolineae bacterium]